MSLKVQQLNADTTFLLTFSPPFAPDDTASRFPGDFRILIDPWLKGPSSILHPSFQISHHVAEPAVGSLRELKRSIDVIIISQDKPDHCHKETLCSLPRNSKVRMLATSAAAKRMRSWNHFNGGQVDVMKPYDASDPMSIIDISLPGYGSPNSGAGRVSIANIPSKRDMAGLHNAIGITYQPPSSTFTLNTQDGRHESGSTVQLSASGVSRPSKAPRPRTAGESAPFEPLDWTSKNRRDKPGRTPNSSHVRIDSANVSCPMNTTNTEKTISIIYTPHGLAPDLLMPYLTNHLTPLGACPVLALFHSMTVETNPWWMGGKVSLGTPGGLELARALGNVRYWIGAHDEEKENLGLATRWCKTRTYATEEVSQLLRSYQMEETMVLRLQVGEEVRLPIKRVEGLEMNGTKKASTPVLLPSIEPTTSNGG